MLNDDNETMVIFPAGTHFFGPDPINRVSIMFPDRDSAILFFEWCRQRCADAELED